MCVEPKLDGSPVLALMPYYCQRLEQSSKQQSVKSEVRVLIDLSDLYSIVKVRIVLLGSIFDLERIPFVLPSFIGNRTTEL